MNRIPPLVVILAAFVVISEQRLVAETTIIGLPVATEPSSNFRVTTTIYSGNDKEASAEHLILFSDSLVYDLPQLDDTIVSVFDPQRGRVILLNRATQVRTTISTDDLMKLTAQLRAAATDANKQERLGLSATTQPIVNVAQQDVGTIDDSLASIGDSLSDGYMIRYGDVQYEVLTQTPRTPSISRQYAQFADWALRLNVARRIGSAPFGRMTLNQQVAAVGKLPRITTLTIRRGLTSDRFRSTHEVIEQLSESDRKTITEVGGMLAIYREVSFAEFH